MLDICWFHDMICLVIQDSQDYLNKTVDLVTLKELKGSGRWWWDFTLIYNIIYSEKQIKTFAFKWLPFFAIFFVLTALQQLISIIKD